KLVKQACVLDCDHRLGCEILHQGNLLVVKRPNLLAVDDNRSDQLPLLEHRHGEKSSCARQFDKGDHEVITFNVSLLSREVVNVDYIFRSGDAGERDIRMITYVNYRLALPELRVGSPRAGPCDCA